MMLRSTTISEIAGPEARSIAIGPFGSALKADMYTMSGIPVVRGQNITSAPEIDLTDVVYVAPAAAEKLPACNVKEGDLVFPHRGAIGRVGIVGKTPALLSSSMMKLTCDPAKADSRFVLYYFRGPGHRELMMRASTVGTPGIGQPLTSLRGIPIHLPSLDQQRAIADVLSALDDKITANRRLDDLQDEYFLARWSALAERAENARLPLAELVESPIAGDWGSVEETSEYVHRVYCLRGADMKSLQRFTAGNAPSRYLKMRSLERRKVRHGDIVVEMSGGSPTQSTGRAGLITNSLLTRLSIPVVSSNFCKVLRPKNLLHASLIYAEIRTAWARGDFFQFENGTTGIKNLAFNEFASSRQISIPSDLALRAFSDLSDSLFIGMEARSAESATLAGLRDTLLPELMSGRLRVKDAEKKIEEVV